LISNKQIVLIKVFGAGQAFETLEQTYFTVATSILEPILFQFILDPATSANIAASCHYPS